MKRILFSVFSAILWTNYAHAQNFNLPVYDSVSLVLTDGAINVRTFRYENRYDSFFMEAREELDRQKERLIAANNGFFPPEIRMYKMTGRWEIKIFAEAEPYNPGIEEEKKFVLSGLPRPDYKIVFYDLFDVRIHSDRIILTAEDSVKMQALLKTDMSYWRNQVLNKKNNDKKSVLRSYWRVRNDSLYPSPYFHSNSYNRKEHLTSRLYFGPGISIDGFYLNTFLDYGYVIYDSYRQPALRMGLYTSASYGTSFVSDSVGWKANTFTTFGAKVSLYNNGKNNLWTGIKTGVAYQTLEGRRRQFFNLGFSFDNTRLLDYDIDFFFSSGDRSKIMLTVKLPF